MGRYSYTCVDNNSYHIKHVERAAFTTGCKRARAVTLPTYFFCGTGVLPMMCAFVDRTTLTVDGNSGCQAKPHMTSRVDCANETLTDNCFQGFLSASFELGWQNWNSVRVSENWALVGLEVLVFALVMRLQNHEPLLVVAKQATGIRTLFLTVV